MPPSKGGCGRSSSPTAPPQERRCALLDKLLREEVIAEPCLHLARLIAGDEELDRWRDERNPGTKRSDLFHALADLANCLEACAAP